MLKFNNQSIVQSLTSSNNPLLIAPVIMNPDYYDQK